MLVLGLAVIDACADDEPPFVPGEAVLRLSPGTDPLSVVPPGTPPGTAVLESIDSRSIHRYRVPPSLTEAQWIDLVDDDPRVLATELNYIAEDRNPDGGTQSIFILERIDAFLSQPAMTVVGVSSAQTAAQGHGILVAVLDSGIDHAHPLFRGRLPFGTIDLVTAGGPASDIADGLDNDGDGLIDEMVGHGTLVAGITLRVAPRATLLPIRVLDSDGGSTSFRVADGIYTAIDHGVDIINISLGTTAESLVLRDAIDEAVSAGTLVVASAGNDATDQAPRFPAGFSDRGVLSVGASRADDTAAPFTNFGSFVSLVAPGDPVVGSVPGAVWGSARGTSFSTPIAAGTAALVRSLTPCVPMDLVRLRILDTCTDIDTLNPDFAGKLGAGRLRADFAVGSAQSSPALAFSADLDGNRRVNIDDLYELHQHPADINADGLADARDRADLEAFLRRFEGESRRRTPR